MRQRFFGLNVLHFETPFLQFVARSLEMRSNQLETMVHVKQQSPQTDSHRQSLRTELGNVQDCRIMLCNYDNYVSSKHAGEA